MTGITQLIRDEIEQPITVPMDLVHLVLLVGLISVIAFAWSRVLRRVHGLHVLGE